ncbi:MAG: pyridoxamine 5'-phosphate oxidase [Saprospiraceae bacterium]|jgi:pyridoxamine 5'-phosphate oxidase
MENDKFKQRTDYTLNHPLNEKEFSSNPFEVFNQWYDVATERVEKDPNAMTLSTYDGEFPRARVVLLKELDEKGFVYFTNYLSDKVKETDAHPKASLTFYWKELERQVRIEGVMEKISPSESEDYFKTRPFGSRIGAWVSPQSKEIPDRQWLDEKVIECEAKFKEDVKRPDFWGGLRLVPTYFEFWQGQSSRLHDRIVFEKINGEWSRKRLAP